MTSIKNDIENKSPSRNSFGPDAFIVQIYQTFERELTSMPFKLFHKLRKLEMKLYESPLCCSNRHYDQGNLWKERIYLNLWFQRVKNLSWWGGMAICSRRGGRNGTLRAHILKSSQEVEKANWKWCKSLNSQNLHPMTYLLQQDRAF